jgi:Pyruvate/2-oxoacid:ferredoxin oxidoreductase delta subunit
MSEMTAPNLRVVLYEGPGSTPLDAARRVEVLTSLLEAGYQVTRTAPGGQVTPADGTPVLILGQYNGQHPTSAGNGEPELHVRDITGFDNADLVGVVDQVRESLGGDKPGAWHPWFPVIDYERCTNCMQCLTFCLFDVYSVDGEHKIKVQNESNCKTNCPACSRVCPEVAIMFPKYTKAPINGAVVRKEDIQSEAMKVDISALLGGDFHASLRNRQKEARKRFSTERDESRALLERKRCLKKLKKDLDIPDEVLMTLPSAGDIEERVRRAREKATKRMARSQTVKDQRPAPSEDEWGI